MDYDRIKKLLRMSDKRRIGADTVQVKVTLPETVAMLLCGEKGILPAQTVRNALSEGLKLPSEGQGRISRRVTLPAADVELAQAKYGLAAGPAVARAILDQVISKVPK